MSFSLNEIEAMGKRAARGVGVDWGIAEEAGKAARWLAGHGLPGPELLAELLTQNEGRSYDALAPVAVDGVWEAKSGRLCPLVAGAALSDRAGEIAGGRTLELGPIAFPLLLAPYAAWAAVSQGPAVKLIWSDVALTVSSDNGLATEGDIADLSTRTADQVICRAVKEPVKLPEREFVRRAVDAETWSRLNAFAHRTFAPATEASRLAGAGAGLTDND